MEAVKLLILQLLAATSCYAESIDTLQPIFRVSPDPPQNESLFGYSLVLHQIEAVSSPAEAITSTRIVVSAPKRTTEGGILEHTGAVYLCPVEPGPCQRSSNRWLYDTTGNEGNGNKTNQFLGASMASDGQNLVVCAHRYNYDTGSNRIIPGRCFASSNRELSNFNDFQPCMLVGSRGLNSAGFCQVGVSSVIIPGTTPVYGLGAPGFYGWRGSPLSMTSNSASDIERVGFGVGTTDIAGTINYQGYAITTGYFSDLGRLDYAVSAPRFGLYMGAVNIIIRDNGLTLVSQPALRGMQMGEGYGFSVLGANLLGDQYSELLVGAPFYRANGTQPDAGRVIVYSNNRGSLSQLRVIFGFKAFSRFGYAMANLGDITGDGYDDIAIGAPFSNSDGSGVVYIYHSTSMQGLTINPQQIIVGSDLSLSGVTDFRGFGAALASGIDVDGNSYNDLAIGAFEAQSVFVLRTRPIAMTTTTFGASPQIVDLEALSCSLSGQMYACFNVTTCAEYSGPGLSNTLVYQFNLTADTRSIEKRIFFSNMESSILENITLTGGAGPTCRTNLAYVRNNAVDRFNSFNLEFGLSIPQPTIQQGNGNLPIQTFNDYPVLQRTGNTEIQVETLKNCSGMVCVPDLRVSVQGTSTVMMDGSMKDSNIIVVGGVRNVLVRLQVQNAAEDAFQASVTITIPPALEFGRVTGMFMNNGQETMETLTCTPVQNSDGMTSSSRCIIGNPFVGPDNSVIVTVTLMPLNTLIGNEGDLTVSFSASSINAEAEATVNDGSNQDSTMLKVQAEADITVDFPGIVSPEQLTYSRTPPNASITRVDQLGPMFSVSFVVRNSGPSTVRNIRLVVNWPLNGTNSGGFFYLYPAQFSTSETGATITCSNENINPRSLILADDSDQNEQGSTGTGGKRRKRSISKRQNVAVPSDSSSSTTMVNEEQSTVNQTISCADSGPVLNCVPIECTIIGLQGTANAQARVNIIGYVDERFFSTSIDRFTIVPNATVAIIGEDFIIQPNPDVGKSANATVRLIPAAVVAIGERRAVPWWVIVLPIVAAVIVIIVIAVILWALGFFKRKKHAEIKQRREELENLEQHEITAEGSTDGIIAS